MKRFLSPALLAVLYVTMALVATLLRLLRWHRVRIERQVARCLPELDPARRRRVVTGFYRYLGELAAEILYGGFLTPQALATRVRFDDTERVAAALRGQRRVLILSAHHANWEWLLLRCSTGFDAPLTAVYRPLFDARLDRYARSVRQRFGCTMVRTDAIVQHLLERRGGVRLLAMLADQSPAVTSEQQAWPQFFGQPTAFHRGPGWIASKLDYAPYFAAMRRERRGHYVVDLVALSPGGQPAGPDVVVEAYVRALEAHVRRHPEQYFWAYNRWKREKPLYA